MSGTKRTDVRLPMTHPRGAQGFSSATAGILALTIAMALAARPAGAQYNGVPASGMMTKGGMPAGVTPDDLKRIDLEQRLGAQLPLDLPLRDETGRPVSLGQYFDGKPVVLTLVYFQCPMLCPETLNGVVGALKLTSLQPGSDFNLVTVSFNPKDTPALAATEKQRYVERYRRPAAARSWHFLTGDDTAIKLLTEKVGFHYFYDASSGQYAHPTGVMVITPQGKVARYFYGIEYSPRDMRLALVEASSGRIGTPVDKVLLYCYHYDPATGKYSLVVLNVMRLGGIVTVALLGAFLLVMWRQEKKGVPGHDVEQKSAR